jgi:hypothetical protein
VSRAAAIAVNAAFAFGAFVLPIIRHRRVSAPCPVAGAAGVGEREAVAEAAEHPSRLDLSDAAPAEVLRDAAAEPAPLPWEGGLPVRRPGHLRLLGVLSVAVAIAIAYALVLTHGRVLQMVAR